jgi:hypothetical protein
VQKPVFEEGWGKNKRVFMQIFIKNCLGINFWAVQGEYSKIIDVVRGKSYLLSV